MACVKQVTESIFVALVCGALVLWSVGPAFGHAPRVFETLQDHLEMVADHGHSHGFEEDLYWAMHGHSHDVADHDHNQAFLSKAPRTAPIASISEIWLSISAFSGPSRQFRIDRPPRA